MAVSWQFKNGHAFAKLVILPFLLQMKWLLIFYRLLLKYSLIKRVQCTKLLLGWNVVRLVVLWMWHDTAAVLLVDSDRVCLSPRPFLTGLYLESLHAFDWGVQVELQWHFDSFILYMRLNIWMRVVCIAYNFALHKFFSQAQRNFILYLKES